MLIPVRYAGVLAPAAKWSARIVPAGVVVSAEIVPATDADGADTPPCTAECLAKGAAADPSSIEASLAARGRNYTWAELMKRVWGLRCAGVVHAAKDECESSQRFTHRMR